MCVCVYGVWCSGVGWAPLPGVVCVCACTKWHRVMGGPELAPPSVLARATDDEDVRAEGYSAVQCRDRHKGARALLVESSRLSVSRVSAVSCTRCGACVQNRVCWRPVCGAPRSERVGCIDRRDRGEVRARRAWVSLSPRVCDMRCCDVACCLERCRAGGLCALFRRGRRRRIIWRARGYFL